MKALAEDSQRSHEDALVVMGRKPTEAAQWNAVVARDAAMDGRFYYGVVTTGVYCRPSCRSRRPLRKNVRFYATPQAAERDGLRACKRCRPAQESREESFEAKMRDLCAYIEEHAAENPSLAVLAERAGLSVFYLQRRFKATVGVTPIKYVEACRLESFKSALRSGSKVVDALYDAGFGSSSRLYERVDSRLGMTPTQYRRRGKDLHISYTTFESSFGPLTIAATDRGVCFVRFGSRAAAEAELSREFPEATRAPVSATRAGPLQHWAEALRRHLEGNAPHLDLPLDVRGTVFQIKVWSFLQSIPRGEVRSYADVASGIGHPRATRAVGTACGKNPVALLVPCHRVIRGDGAPGDYRWGESRKRKLLRAEGVELE